MKGAFETALVILFGMMFLVMGMDYVGVILQNNQARSLAENTLAILEHQNRLDEQVQTLIDESHIQCNECSMTLQPHPQYPERLWVIVRYPIRLAYMGYQSTAEIRYLTRPLG